MKIPFNMKQRLVAGLLVQCVTWLVACGSGGDGESIGLSTSSSSEAMTISGTVSAPGGVLTAVAPLTPLEWLASLVVSESLAQSMPGFLPVPGAEVIVYQVSDQGRPVPHGHSGLSDGVTIARTVTGTDGSYSVTLPDGFSPNSRTIVQAASVATPIGILDAGNAVHTVIAPGSVDINSVTEAALEAVVEYLASHPHVTWEGAFTHEELSQLMSAIRAEVEVNLTLVGSSTTSTTTNIRARLATMIATALATFDGATESAPTILTMALPIGTVGKSYNAHLQAVGGNGIYSWSVTPPSALQELGLALDSSTGVISGQPSVPTGNPLAIMLLVASRGGSASQQVFLSINGEIAGSRFHETAYLKAITPIAAGLYGALTAVSGDTVAVGYEHRGVGRGYVDLWRHVGASTQWSRSTLDLGQLSTAYSIAMQDKALVINGNFIDTTTGIRRQGLNLYREGNPGSWNFSAFVPWPGNVGWGGPVIFDGSTLVIGGGGNYSSSGMPPAVAVYNQNASGEWITPPVQLSSPNALAADRDGFGEAFALSGHTLVLGASRENTLPLGSSFRRNHGGVFVYTRNSEADVWSKTAHLHASVPTDQAAFGAAVALQGNFLAVGAPGACLSPSDCIRRPGSVYLFLRDPNTGVWAETAILRSNDSNDFDFGRTLALKGDRLIISSQRTISLGVFASQVHVYHRASTGDWIEEQVLTASNAGAGDGFGSSLAFDGVTIVSGAPREDGNGIDPGDNSVRDSGAAYIYQRQ